MADSDVSILPFPFCSTTGSVPSSSTYTAVSFVACLLVDLAAPPGITGPMNPTADGPGSTLIISTSLSVDFTASGGITGPINDSLVLGSVLKSILLVDSSCPLVSVGQIGPVNAAFVDAA